MANNELDSAIQTLFKLGCKVKKLWENASVASTFKGQTVKAITKDYDFIIIDSKYSKTGVSYECFIISKNSTEAYMRLFASAEYSNVGYSSRLVKFTDSTVNFSDNFSKNINTATGGTINNDYQIPARIFGVKLLGGVQLKAYLRRFLAVLQRGCLLWLKTISTRLSRSWSR